MSRRWVIAIFAAGLILTVINLAILAVQIASPAQARGGGTALLQDDDFVAGLTKLVRKTVRDYCTVGKKQGIDC